MIDFRSDTVTRPTAVMKAQMMEAPLGDDVFGDDPTVNELEAKAAEMFGHEAAVFCPSGTMTNQIAIKVHTQPGDEVICDELSHIYHYEGGGIAYNSGCSVKLLCGASGVFTPSQVLEAINPDDQHFPVSKLVSIENTCNKGGGTCWSLQEMQAIREVCNDQSLALHLDGARLFNAMVASDLSAKEVGPLFDSISICLSKGLGCPVGSLLLGSKEFIAKARRVRKVFGGAMRQAGLLAAAGIYALDHHVERLAEDHAKAVELASMFQDCRWVQEVKPPTTNIVIVSLAEGVDQGAVIDRLKDAGILVVGFGPGKIRLVTHLDISEADLNQCRTILKNVRP